MNWHKANVENCSESTDLKLSLEDEANSTRGNLIMLSAVRKALSVLIGMTFFVDASAQEGGFVINGMFEGDRSGWSVDGIGDVDLDGVPDFAIGAPLLDWGGLTDAGAVFIVHGREHGFPPEVDLIDVFGPSKFGSFIHVSASVWKGAGSTVSRAGDLNDDSYSDFVFFHSRYNGERGRSYVLFGQPGGLPSTIAIPDTSVERMTTIDGSRLGDRAGQTLSSLGDIDGDGIDDLLVGTPHAEYDPTGSWDGEAYVVFGKDVLPANIALSDLSGDDGFIVTGANGGDELSRSISGAGRVNDDEFNDFLLGSPRADLMDEEDNSGVAFLIFGSDTGFPAQLNPWEMSNSEGIRFQDGNRGSLVGQSVAGIGDINDDGHDDIAIGAPGVNSGGHSDTGIVYVVFGGPWLADREIVDLTTLNGDNGFVVVGAGPLDSIGEIIVGGHDLTGDGIDDFVIGADGVDEIYVIAGRERAYRFASTVTLRWGPQTDGTSADGFGHSISIPGDINGDGHNDLIIGAPTASVPTQSDGILTEAGRTYVIFGPLISSSACPRPDAMTDEMGTVRTTPAPTPSSKTGADAPQAISDPCDSQGPLALSPRWLQRD